MPCCLCCVALAQVHYGYASLHPVSRTPALCVLPKRELDVQQTSTWLVQQLARLHEQVQQGHDNHQQQPMCVICSDQGYLHQLPELQQAVQAAYSGPLQLVFAQGAAQELWPQGAASGPQPAATGGCGSSSCCANGTGAAEQPSNSSPASGAAAEQPEQRSRDTAPVPIGGLIWQLPGNTTPTSTQHTGGSSGGAAHMVWLGPSASPALTHLQLSFASNPWLLLDPDTQAAAAGLSPGLDRLMKRRYYLVERARGASMVGLLVGTLGAAGYKTALEQLRRLAGEVRKGATSSAAVGRSGEQQQASYLGQGVQDVLSGKNCLAEVQA